MEIKYQTTGTARAFTGAIFEDITWETTPWVGYEISVKTSNNEHIVTDYDDRFDVMYYPSDDGTENYSSMVVLGDGELEGKVPSKELLREAIHKHIHHIVNAVMDESIDPSEIGYFRLVCSCPAHMYRRVNKHKNEDAAVLSVVREIFEVKL